MSRTVTIDDDLCIGCAACVEACPEIFQMGPGGQALVLNPDAGSDESLAEAVELCPVKCIAWEKD